MKDSLLDGMPTEFIEIVKEDGRQFNKVVALISSKSILVEDTSVPIQEGDLILRALPNGLTERFIVTDSGFHRGMDGIADHYQIKVRKETAISSEKVAQTITQHFHGNVGNVATGGSHFQQHAYVNPVGQQLNVDFATLQSELARLRATLKTDADEPEQFAALGDLAAAGKAIDANDQPKLIEHLKAAGQKAGPWLLAATTSIGTTVAAEAIKHALHL